MTGKIISIYSSKGGVGKTFVAVNLSVDIHLETKRKVVLIDFGRPFSIDVAKLLNITDLKRMETILASAKELSPSIIKSFVTPHPSGVAVLSLTNGENDLSEDVLNPSSIEAVLTKLKMSYDFIIADIGMKYGPVVERIFDLSALILVPVVPDYLSVQQTRSDLGLLRRRNFPKDMIRPVANMIGKNDYVSLQVLEQQLRRSVTASIPYDDDAMSKLTKGTYPSDFPRHMVTKAFDDLAFHVINDAHYESAPSKASSRAAAVKAQLGEGEVQVGSAGEMDELKLFIHEKLLETIDFKRLDTEVENSPEKLEELRNEVTKKVVAIIDTETSIRSRNLRDQLLREVLQEALGLGPLEDLLVDTSISEIMVNRWDQVYVEKRGKLTRIEKKFLSERHLMNIIGRIVAPIGRKIDMSTPMVDARLKDGSRVNAIIPPLAIGGAVLTIRKFFEGRLGMEEMIRFGTLNVQIAEFLKAAVNAKLNILISGGTGSGKTTLLNVLSGFIPADERIVTIEDSAELQLQQPHVITLEGRPPNIEGKGEVTIRDLVRNSLRMRPDRIVVGECRGGEALDMLQAMNTGHDGSLTTVHANSTREALSRLETLVMYTGLELPTKAIKEQISGAIDLTAQIRRFKDGSRKIVQISEITGTERDVITMGDIFLYKQTGEEESKAKGSFVSTGYIPKCLERFKERGIEIPREIFWSTSSR